MIGYTSEKEEPMDCKLYGPMTNAGVPNVGVDKHRSGHLT